MDIVNTVCTKSLMVFNIQDQLLPNKSAGKYSDSTNREKLSQIYKEKESQEIITNTTVNNDNANHGKGAPGNPNPAQHMKKVPTPQRIPSLVASKIPQKTKVRGFILKATSNSRITYNNTLAGFRNTPREVRNKFISVRCLSHLYPFTNAEKAVSYVYCIYPQLQTTL